MSNPSLRAAAHMSATDSNPILVQSSRTLSATDSNPIILSKSTQDPVRSYARSRRPRAKAKLPPPWRLLSPAAVGDKPVVGHAHFTELKPGSIVDNLYEIDAQLGAGTMGEIYAARHVKLGKHVAIKVIRGDLCQDSAAMDRFAMEARALAQIQHPAIVAVEHVGELADGRAYFVMEHLRGESLGARIQRGLVPLAEALRILDQMARALEAAHAHGVIHRDLKPENTYLVHLAGEEPIIKLLDFGLAKLAEGADDRPERTRSGTAVGTPLYMSPEQARGSADVDYRADIYALGCIAYKLLLGYQPFDYAKSAPEMFAAHLNAPPPSPRSIWPKIPEHLDQCLFAMLAKDPAERPTLSQIRADFADVMSRVGRERETKTAPPRRFMSTMIFVIAMIAVVGIFPSAPEAPEGSTEPPSVIMPSAPPTVIRPRPATIVVPTVAPPVVAIPPKEPPSQSSSAAAASQEQAPHSKIEVPQAPRPTSKIRKRAERRVDAPPTNEAPASTPSTTTSATPVDAVPVAVPETATPDKNMTINPFKAR